MHLRGQKRYPPVVSLKVYRHIYFFGNYPAKLMVLLSGCVFLFQPQRIHYAMYNFEASVLSDMRGFKKAVSSVSANTDVSVYGAEFRVLKPQITKARDKYPF
jgi:hypothetical protein